MLYNALIEDFESFVGERSKTIFCRHLWVLRYETDIGEFFSIQFDGEGVYTVLLLMALECCNFLRHPSAKIFLVVVVVVGVFNKDLQLLIPLD